MRFIKSSVSFYYTWDEWGTDDLVAEGRDSSEKGEERSCVIPTRREWDEQCCKNTELVVFKCRFH
jgi:hypothetical protein